MCVVYVCQYVNVVTATISAYIWGKYIYCSLGTFWVDAYCFWISRVMVWPLTSVIAVTTTSFLNVFIPRP